MNRLLAAWVVLVWLLATAPLWADQKVDAQKHFEVGLALLKADDFSGAQVEFEASIALYPTKGAIYNLANCYRALHEYQQAIGGFERLLAAYGDALDAEMKADVDQQLAELKGLIAELHIQVNRADAAVSLNGERIGTSPLDGSLLLGPGQYHIEVELPGHERQEQRITLTSGDKESVSFELTPVVAEPPTNPPDPPLAADQPAPAEAVSRPAPALVTEAPPDSRRGMRIAGWVVLGVGAAAAVGGVVTGFVALDTNAWLDESCPDETCAPKFQPDIDDLDRMTGATNVLLFGGGAVALGGAALLIFARRGQNRESARTSLAPRIGPGFAGGVIRTDF